MVEGGVPCGFLNDGETTIKDLTIISTSTPIDVNGVLKKWCCTVSGVCEGALRVFRSNGTYWDYVGGSSTISLSWGVNSNLNCNITVQAGDVVGVFVDSLGTLKRPVTNGAISGGYYQSGDITSNSLKSAWSYESQGSPKVYVRGGILDVYVHSTTGNDSNAGDSCAAGHPVLTFSKAYDLVDSTGNIHVCNSTADFSGETIDIAKSINIELVGDGYYYLPTGT